MRTMYRVDTRMTDEYGHNGHTVKGTEYYNTYEEAVAYATNNVVKDVVNTGDWKVVARTINEEAFTVVDEVVEEYDWYEEVGKYEDVERDIAFVEGIIKNRENAIKRCKKEETIKRHKEEIRKWKERLNEYHKIKEEKEKRENK